MFKAQGRLPGARPVAIVDIGSNSVRLVAYEGLTRAPTPLFNEKAMCALGKGVATTGELAEEGMNKALEALRKGAQSLSEAMQQGEGEGQQSEGPGNRAGRQQSGGNQTDPLGRPLHGREFGDDFTVKIPGEIDVQRARRILEELRRRLADPQRPQIELDYLERLLKDY